MAPKMSTTPKRKQKNSVPTQATVLAKRRATGPTIYVHTFAEPLSFEAYIFETAPANEEDNFAGNDGYTAAYRKVMKGELKCKYLTDAFFSSYVFRRDPKSADPDGEILTGGNGIYRLLMIRYPSKTGSTKQTRQEGLAVLKRFLQDKQFSDYPSSRLETVDASNQADPPALDEFFRSYDIKTFIEEDIDASELDEKFYSKHKRFAQKCWSVTKPSDWALSLGFPTKTT